MSNIDYQAEEKWQELISYYTEQPQDLRVMSKINRPGRWFHAYGQEGELYISHAQLPEHQDYACSFIRVRHMQPEDFAASYALYSRWLAGEKIWGYKGALAGAEDPKLFTYWFGLFLAAWPPADYFGPFRSQEGRQIWQQIMAEFTANPRDVCTVPKNRRPQRWFYVYGYKSSLYVETSRQHQPEESCQIKQRRFLRPTELEDLLSFFRRRRDGEKVFRESTARCRNQVYWYGIFAEMGL